MKILTFIIVMFFGVANAHAQNNTTRLTDDQIYNTLSKKLNYMVTRTDHGLEKGGRGRLFAWYWGYLGRASLMMYEATKEDRFLDLVRDISLKLIDVRDDKLGLVDDERKRILPNWGTQYKNGVRANEVTSAGLITLPMCQYARIRGDEVIGRAAIESLSAFLDEKQVAFGGYFFHHYTQDIVEPLNHTHVYGAALAHCSLLPYAPKSYPEVALGIHKYWKHFIRKDGKGYSWPYKPAPDSPLDQQSEAIWKAGVTVELPIALVETGIMKDTKIIDQMAETFLTNPIVKKGGVPQFIGTDILIDISTREKFDGSNLPGLFAPFVMLNRPKVQETFVGMVKNHPTLFSRGWFGGPRSMFMSYAYLRSRGVLK